MSLFVSTEDLEHLTGKRRPSAQIRWLKAKGYRFTVNGLGQPVVAVCEATRKLIGGTHAANEQPNWGALGGAAA